MELVYSGFVKCFTSRSHRFGPRPGGKDRSRPPQPSVAAGSPSPRTRRTLNLPLTTKGSGLLTTQPGSEPAPPVYTRAEGKETRGIGHCRAGSPNDARHGVDTDRCRRRLDRGRAAPASEAGSQRSHTRWGRPCQLTPGWPEKALSQAGSAPGAPPSPNSSPGRRGRPCSPEEGAK